MKKILSLFLATALMCTAFVACTAPAEEGTSSTGGDVASQTETLSGSISASGASALKPLADVAAEAFMDLHQDVAISVAAGGSGTGLNDVSAGTVDIGNSDVFAEEKLDAEQAAELVDHKVCTITIAAVVNKDLGIDNVTQEQLIDIFTGEVTNWSEVGGPDLEIMLITRPESSGTRALFETYALDGNKETSNSSQETDNSGELITKVTSNQGAIGYVAMSYFSDDIQPLAIDGAEPTLENTYNGSYTVWGYEHMYTKGEAEGIAKAFIEYVMSDDFAANIEENGYGVTSKLSEEAIASHE